MNTRKSITIRIIPSLWLIGADGKVMLNNLAANELKTPLAHALSAAAAPAPSATSDPAAKSNMHLSVGQVAPDFTFATPQGPNMKLSDFRGKYVLLQFWATQSGESMRDMPNIRDVYTAYAADPRLKVASIFVDFEEDELVSYRSFLPLFSRAWNLNWLQGHCSPVLANGYFAIAGTYGIPQICLIGPDGKVLANNLHGDAITAAVTVALGANGDGHVADAGTTPQ